MHKKYFTCTTFPEGGGASDPSCPCLWAPMLITSFLSGLFDTNWPRQRTGSDALPNPSAETKLTRVMTAVERRPVAGSRSMPRI